MSARGDRRRRLLLFAVGLLILLGMSPIVGHHVAGGMDRLILGADHLGPLCLVALHHFLRPVHDLIHALLAAGLAYATWDRVQAARLLKRTLAAVEWERPEAGSGIEAAARSAGVDPGRILVARGLPVPAFTAGWLRPRIYLTRELADRLTPAELAAVIAHEGVHADRRDPLTLSVLRFVGHTLFWIPVLRRLAQDCADEAEIRADDAARRGQPLALASALLRVAEWQPAPRPGIGVGIRGGDLFARRIRRLAGEEVRARSHVTRRSLLGAAASLALVWATGLVMAHPLPAAGAHAEHCEHAGSPAWTHLLCAHRSSAVPPGICPHTGR